MNLTEACRAVAVPPRHAVDDVDGVFFAGPLLAELTEATIGLDPADALDLADAVADHAHRLLDAAPRATRPLPTA